MIEPIMGGDGVAPDLSRYRRYIESALVHGGGTHTYDDVLDLIAAGRALAWTGPASVIITEISVYPRKTILNFWIAGGEAPRALAEVEQMTPIILDWARTQGCTQATFTGRRGWEKTFLSRTGWQFPLVTASRDL